MTRNDPPAAASTAERILAALAALGPATAARIAEHTGLGYSTVTARLRKLATAGQATHHRPDDGPLTWRRTSDPTHTDPAPAPVGDPTRTDPAPAVAGEHPHAAAAPIATPAGHTDTGGTPTNHTDGAGAAAPAGGAASRRGKGQLRAQVLAVLQDNPDQPYTPHQLSKQLDGASSGAIVLAARKLVLEGSVRQVKQSPATFQAE
jgi:hypothetical protein